MNLSKITGVIVNEQRNIVGFKLQGPAKELMSLVGLEPDKMMEVSATCNQLFSFNNGKGFRNGQVYFNSQGKAPRIELCKGFSFVWVKKYMQFRDGHMEPIANIMNIVAKEVENNTVKRYIVVYQAIDKSDIEHQYEKFKATQSEAYKLNSLSISELVLAARLFQPGNFVVKHRKSDSGSQTIFVTGKSGYSLSKLPSITWGGNTSKKFKPAMHHEDAPGISTMPQHEFDIMDLFTFVREVSGYIVNFADTEYETITKSAVTGSSFHDFGLGEVGSPYLSFNEKELNISCLFKRLGYIPVKIDGETRDIVTVINRSKTLFYNGVKHLSEFGVIVPEKSAQYLVTKFSGAMSLSEITDRSILEPISILINKDMRSMRYFRVLTGTVGMIAESKLNGYILPTNVLYTKVSEIVKSQFILKAVKGLLRDDPFAFRAKEVAPQFVAMSPSQLQQVVDAGIDIYDASYKGVEPGKKTKANKDSSLITIQYRLAGKNINYWSFDKLRASEEAPDYVKEIFAQADNSPDAVTRFDWLNQLKKVTESVKKEYSRELWLHKCAMYLKSNGVSVHHMDANNWRIDESSRVQVGKDYVCTLPGCEDLHVVLSGSITIM